jgi:predicted dehydrogenase
MNNRRNFLRSAAAMTAAPFILPGRVWAADTAPSSRITMGFVGMGIQNRGLLGAFLGQPGVQVVAVCDVDKNRRESAKKRVEERYSKEKPDGWKGCEAYNDFRELVARKDIDAVCIATPDHWHAIITVAALAAGKDVYCEKPLTHNIHESIVVIDAVKKHNRVLQTGSMQRSSGEFRVAAELVQNGVIGKISRVECQFGGPPRANDLPEESAEPGLDWDRWLGPAPVKPYSSVLSPRGLHSHFPLWREYSEYGGGYVCDWGAHHLDIAQWGLGMDGSGPVEVRPSEGSVEKIAQKKNLNVDGCELVYASGVIVQHKKQGFGVHFFGENGEVKVNRGKFEVALKGETVAKKDEKGSVERAYMTAERDLLKDAKIKLYKSTNHIADFLDCVRSRKKPITNEIVGGGTAIACHLMNISYLLGKPFKWDPAKHEFAGGTGDSKFLTREYRGEWTV